MSELTSIKQILTALKPELRRKYHVESLGLFGSVVRDDFGPHSDIDILVDFSKPIGIEFIDLADQLEIALKKKVDLISKKGVKPTYLKSIESDIVYV
ncbi:MAG: DNA polymerase subunit beta [Sphingobacteriaceae bacterium]|nr:DNA polymerase subunit beta [Sphingobacteriaceae bacterium]